MLKLKQSLKGFKQKLRRKHTPMTKEKLSKRLKVLKWIILFLVLSVLVAIVFNIIQSGEINKRQREIENRQIQIEQIDTKLNDSRKKLDDQEITVQEYQKEVDKLNKEKEDLNSQLQAKVERQKQEQIAYAESQKKVSVQQTVSQPVQSSPQVSGSKADWLAASGIPQSEWGYVDSIVTKESGWNPNAVNSSSGACGLGQQLPCGKWAGAWNDPVAALVAMNGYVQKYGGWAGAVSFWQTNRWY